MDLPFTREQLFHVFSLTNTATGMIPVGVGYLAASGWIALRLFHPNPNPSWVRLGMGILWAWLAVGFFWGPFASISGAATIFGGLFLLQGALFFSQAIGGPRSLPATCALHKVLGAVLETYALVVYPAIGLASGHTATDLPWLGMAPCPSTLWTLGVLIGTGGLRKRELLIPLAWCAVGLVAAGGLGVWQDWGLGVAAGVAIWCKASDRRG